MFCSFACFGSGFADTQPVKIEYFDPQTIDEKLKNLHQQLDDLRKKAFNDEMKAQPYMLDDWKQYAEDMEKTEQDEQKVLELKRMIEQLENAKKSLSS